VSADFAGDPAPAERLRAHREREEAPQVGRRLRLTAASTIAPRPVRWLWEDRIPLGSLALLAGREGIGKSLGAVAIAADLTRGRLPGEHDGQPRAVIVAATEDSWAHTIVPRLMAAGADRDLIFRVDVTTAEGVDTGLSLPRDLLAVERAVREVGAALILLDPLMSRLDGQLDTHKDAEVRLALEPLTALADRTGAAVLGLIHLNKSSGSDPLTLIMASRAFAAVARAVLFVMLDPEDETVRLLGQEKNNLGRTDLPTLTFRIASAHVADTAEGPVWTGRVEWVGESGRTIRQALETVGEGSDARTATAEAGAWLEDYLTTQGGTADSKDVRAAGQKAGHSIDALKRARQRLQVVSESYGFPRQTRWLLPAVVQLEQPSRSIPGESALTALTALTGREEAVGAVGAVGGPLQGAGADCTARRDAVTASDAPPRQARCVACCQPMTLVEPGQLAHPTCESWPPARVPSRSELAATR